MCFIILEILLQEFQTYMYHIKIFIALYLDDAIKKQVSYFKSFITYFKTPFNV